MFRVFKNEALLFFFFNPESVISILPCIMPDLIFHVDSLATLPFHGNPVAVCLLEKARGERWMQDISLELNAVETAFLVPRSPNRFDLRTMAGGVEVEFAASATLAAAHVLFTHSVRSNLHPLADPRRAIAFFTPAGAVPATMEDDGIYVNFPEFLLEECSSHPEEILHAVDPAPEFSGKRGNDYLVQVSSEERLRDLSPDFHFLRAMGMRGLIVTSVANRTPSHDFVSRTFYIPGIAGDTPLEDPTASYAHCLLGPFWFLRLGKTMLTTRTDSSGPRHSRYPPALRLVVDGDRVMVIGEAVTVFEGELKI